uniref:Dirigent protein n=1 Tax=Heterorhabditis bacteriophora TaxID=37862 RepID=A0A1I7X5T7_HETBA
MNLSGWGNLVITKAGPPRGGTAEREYHGAGVAIGSRTSVADGLLKLKRTAFVFNVGPTSSTTLVDPNTVGHGKESDSSMHFMCCSAQFYLRSDDC